MNTTDVQEHYAEDLAYIHDVGFGDFALNAAPEIIEVLKGIGPHAFVVELGCGSGLLARELVRAHHEVYGIDISSAMIEMARKKAPPCTFRIGSIFTETIPACDAVVAVGECLNYRLEPCHADDALNTLFQRIYAALRPDGIFIFDIICPGKVAEGMAGKSFKEGEDWVVLVEKAEDRQRNILTRRIVSFRRLGQSYRRSEEIHRVQLYRSADIAESLNEWALESNALSPTGNIN